MISEEEIRAQGRVMRGNIEQMLFLAGHDKRKQMVVLAEVGAIAGTVIGFASSNAEDVEALVEAALVQICRSAFAKYQAKQGGARAD